VGGVHGQLGFSTAIIGSRRAKPAFREDKGRDRVFIPNRLPSPITRARQGAIQFFSQYRLDEAAHAPANGVLDGVEPIVEKALTR